MTYRCDRCRRETDVQYVGEDHEGPGLKLEYRCSMGHLFLVAAHKVQPRRVFPFPAAVSGPAGQ